MVTHVFECTMPGYRGWSWVVVLARASRAKAATVAETALRRRARTRSSPPPGSRGPSV
ncbi:DUF3027 domain-containing protein [Brachybacterium sp. GPGPB12]|uniref:DUF3027 domain-containing protein n=1 Tax=Brachybacterium sp. GPGPB12 TaxID=3023517 RepID=UPI00313462FA